MSKSLFGLSVFVTVLLLFYALRDVGSSQVVAPPEINTVQLTKHANQNCPTQVVHFFSEKCPSCRRADAAIRLLSKDQRKCLVGVSLYALKAKKNKLYHRVIEDIGSGLRIDWGVRKVPTTFWVQGGQVIRVKRDPVTIEDFS